MRRQALTVGHIFSLNFNGEAMDACSPMCKHGERVKIIDGAVKQRQQNSHFSVAVSQLHFFVQTYVNVFSKRMMKPIPNREDEFYGCDQRLYMLPFLEKLVKTLPKNAQIFDVGAGAGDVVDFALKNAPKETVVNIEEPNSILLEAYKHKIQKYSHLNLGIADANILQDYYQSDQ